MKSIVIALALLAINIASAAGEADRCMDAMTQEDINRCVQSNRQQIEKELAYFIEAYKRKLTAQQVCLFENAQAAWEKYRAASCEFNTSNIAGGSAHAMGVAGCMREKAEVRLAELGASSKCKEGDLGCPAWDME